MKIRLSVAGPFSVCETGLAFCWERGILASVGCSMTFGRISVEFRKPPVVEAWIAFRFALTQETIPWDERAAQALMERHFGDFKPDSLFMFTQIEVDAKTRKPNFTGAQEFFDRIRAFSTDRDRCVQARRDTLVFNQLNKGKWPGYEAMRDAAMEAARKYMEFRDLTELIAVELHYRDVVSLPRNSDQGVRIEDWFRVYPHLPENGFGTMSAFKFKVQLPTLCKGANATLSIQNLPLSGEDDSEFKFSVDWHVTSVDKMGDLEKAVQWLDSAHTALRSSFDTAFTPECLALFEPGEGD